MPPPLWKGISMKKAIIAILCIAAVTAVFFLTWNDEGEVVPAVAPLEFDPASISRVDIPLTGAYRYQLHDTGYLKLVNRLLYMSRPTDPQQIVSVWPGIAVRATDITIHQTARAAIAALFEQARYIDDLSSFFVTSGYRSFDHQSEIYENAADRAYVLPPGHSEHQLGLAADILAMGIPMSAAQMSGTREAVWLAENAWRHGLILRYPSWATEITGVAYEPWHFRYVGFIHAWYMRAHDMVLEQYLEYLERSGGFTAVIDGVTYHVLYMHPAGDRLYVPYSLDFIVSASNRGGYVITAVE